MSANPLTGPTAEAAKAIAQSLGYDFAAAPVMQLTQNHPFTQLDFLTAAQNAIKIYHAITDVEMT